MVSGPVSSPSPKHNGGLWTSLFVLHHIFSWRGRRVSTFSSEPGKERNRTNKKQFVNGCKETGAIRVGSYAPPLPHKRWSPPSLPEVDVDVFFRFCCFPFCFFFFFVCFLPFFGHWCLCCFSFSFFLFFCRRCPCVFSFFFVSFLSLGEERGRGWGEGRRGGGSEGWEAQNFAFFFPSPAANVVLSSLRVNCGRDSRPQAQPAKR